MTRHKNRAEDTQGGTLKHTGIHWGTVMAVIYAGLDPQLPINPIATQYLPVVIVKHQTAKRLQLSSQGAESCGYSGTE